ncbi:MAG: hypothetical protein VB080_07550 [Propionicimonas sp.]|uniref:hypothetical protein n=1 Tax=Propionicimonas sp. TaxID=1955623 RepID=UPI002B217FF9|nr:hypothetical protein [Propionicimonas sp.]MEA4944277.1 hypothetical protein [Propionicimonas sp.]
MIPIMIVFGLALGRWWKTALITAAIGWPLLLLTSVPLEGSLADQVGTLLSAGLLGAANAAVGVAVHQGVLFAVRSVRRHRPSPPVADPSAPTPDATSTTSAGSADKVGTRSPARPLPVGSVAFWILVGAISAFGVISMLSIGIFLLVPAAALFIVGGALAAIDNRGLPAVLTGAATAPLFIAWGNRHGPGEFCVSSATSLSCSEQWNPWPFVAAGLVLALLGAVLTWYALRRPPG